VLFLMFNPGPRGTLLSDIIDLALPSGQHYDPDLYIQGVVNQNPGTAKNPVTLFNRGEKIDSNSDVVLSAAIPGPLEYWVKELKQLPGTFAMVHSKVIVIDPYGEKPVVMTGSHNMGPKASGVNDENLLLIEGDVWLAVCRQHHADLQPVSLAAISNGAAREAEMAGAGGRRQVADPEPRSPERLRQATPA
jgi:phosphatidylserine/phosphatidylglycerophosphate/cardiolipin synthase-like enzyme